MKKHILLFLCCIIYLIGVSQRRLQKEYLHYYLRKMYSIDSVYPYCSYKIDQNTYTFKDSIQRNKRMESLSLNKIYSIEYIKPDFGKDTNGIIVIRTIGSQTRKEIEKLFSLAKTKFIDKYLSPGDTMSNPKDPALIIDDFIEYRIWAAKRTLEKINPLDIRAIKIWNSPVNWDNLGKNGKNGLIQIWIAKGKRNKYVPNGG